MRVVSADEIDRALTFPALVDALAAAFRADIVVPGRHHHDVERAGAGGTLLLMPAWTGAADRDGFVGTKIVTVFPDNGARGLASVIGTYLLMDGASGVPLAVLDGTRLTLWRTAAASALAARYLARPDAARMVMVGAGALAPWLIRAHGSQRPLGDVAIWNRRPEAARQLAEGLAAEGLPVRAAEDLESAVREADLVSCATLSTAPLVRGAWLQGGSASRPGRRLQAGHARGRRRSPAKGDRVCRYGRRPDGGRRRRGGPRVRRHPGGPGPRRASSISAGIARQAATIPARSRSSSPWARRSRTLLRRSWCGGTSRRHRKLGA